MFGHEGLVGSGTREDHADGGRVGLLSRGLSVLNRAMREGLARRTLQNPRGLPMDQASIRARADAMGFALDRRFLHATHEGFDGFDLGAAGSGGNAGLQEPAVFLTDGPAVADSYLGGRHVERRHFPEAAPIDGEVGRLYALGARTLPVVVRGLDEMVEWDMDRAHYSPALVDRVFRHARSEGAPGAIMENLRDPGAMIVGPLGSGARPSTVVAVFDPARLRSPHATFDPERAHESDLLAGIGAGLGLGAGAHYAEGADGGEPARYRRGGLAEAPGFEGGGMALPSPSTTSLATRRLAAFRALRGLEPAFRAGLERFVRERPIGVAAPEGAAEAILREGRFRTQFETGTSGGLIGPGGTPSQLRVDTERRVLGLPEDLPAEQRPVYGALRSARPEEMLGAAPSGAEWRGPAHYGDHLFLLGDGARRRSTYTWGDSLGVGLAGQPGAMARAYRFDEPVAAPAELAAAAAPLGWDARRSPIRLADRLRQIQETGGADDAGFSLRIWPETYVETQTRGPVTTDDVSALLVPGWTGREDAIRGWASDRRIPVYRHVDVAEDRDLQRHLGLRVLPGAVGAGAAFEGLVGREDGGERYAAGGLADGPAPASAGAPGPEDELAQTQGAARRGLAAAAEMWSAADSLVRGGGRAAALLPLG